ncbi:MAG: lipopolysaccharide kinase InaA family protein [Zoogloeaceae bacterium]|jgi:RIO-like serine/threonine protein kinase|nr:lipopolysaccharide kinase InaA family protein [Zoogloeaceae bacterium]
MRGWRLEPAYAHLRAEFGTLDAVFALQGERLTQDPKSEVIRVERAGVRYYVKRYGAGVGTPKNWRRHWGRYLRLALLAYLPRPRVKAEWQNLKQFGKWGIPIPEIVACGMERRYGAFWRGALITRELPATEDLATLARRHDPRLSDPVWVAEISQQVATYTRILHAHHFIHNDLKWRNILVDPERRVYFIDCPWGGYWFGPLLAYRIVKDLATLDKVAKQHLSNRQRLRFYLQYRQQKRLTPADKDCIRRIVHFFEDSA